MGGRLVGGAQPAQLLLRLGAGLQPGPVPAHHQCPQTGQLTGRQAVGPLGSIRQAAAEEVVQVDQRAAGHREGQGACGEGMFSTPTISSAQASRTVVSVASHDWSRCCERYMHKTG